MSLARVFGESYVALRHLQRLCHFARLTGGNDIVIGPVKNPRRSFPDLLSESRIRVLSVIQFEHVRRRSQPDLRQHRLVRGSANGPVGALTPGEVQSCCAVQVLRIHLRRTALVRRDSDLQALPELDSVNELVTDTFQTYEEMKQEAGSGTNACVGLARSAANTPSMLMKHISEPPRPLLQTRPDLPANLAAAIERSLSKAPADRWPDAASFRDALSESAPVSITGAAPRSAPPSAESASRGQGAPATASPSAAPPSLPVLPRAPVDPLMAFGVFRAGHTQGEGDTEIQSWRDQQRAYRAQLRAARRELRHGDAILGAQMLQQVVSPAPLTDDQRVRRVRRKAVNYLATTAILFGVNVTVLRGSPWFLIPAFFMGVGLIRSVASLWADGIPLRKLFTRIPRGVEGARARAAYAEVGVGVPALPAPGTDPMLAAVPRDILEGAHGHVIRDAVEARQVVLAVLDKLAPSEKQLLPEIAPTVKGLVERIISLASALHQLDQDASAEAIARLDLRLADARALPETAPDRERRIVLLERQRQTLADLASRRESVGAQLDNASLVLGTMKLDLLKLRSSGLQSQMADATFQTQDARAVVAEIERALEVAEEVQKIK